MMVHLAFDIVAGRRRYLAPLLAIAAGALALVPRAALAADAAPDDVGPHRHGFTLELGLGVSHTTASPRPGVGDAVGLAPLSLGLGGFLTPDFALQFRASGTSVFVGDTQWMNGFYGAVGQYWMTDAFYVSAGPGVGVFAANPLLPRPTNDVSAGFGLSMRAGLAFLTTKHHSLRVALEGNPSFLRGGAIVGTALRFEWQYY